MLTDRVSALRGTGAGGGAVSVPAAPRAAAPRARSLGPVTPWRLGVLAVLAGAFALRLWGVKQGLPYAYNADENGHFVPKAIGLFGHGWNPHYFVNPPAYTYLLHLVFVVWYGGREGVSHAYTVDPTGVFVVARVVSAALGTLAVGLLYLAGRRLFDRRVGLLAAGLLGTAFLPVFYAHLALNDVPTLAPICLALWGVAGVLRLGRTRDYAIAGLGLGLAAATKYTGGVVIVPLLGAVAAQFLAPGGRGPAGRGMVVAGVAAVVAFAVANPYALLSFTEFTDGLSHQSQAADDALGKLGSSQSSGILYYLWTLTWGLGWVPALAALGALPVLWRDERRLAWLLAPAPVLFVVFMGEQSRFFGRWLMPIFPIVCLLGAYLVLEAADRAGRWRPALRPTFVALAVVALCGQGAVYALHDGEVLSRQDTRNAARDWLVAHVPPGSKIVVEPVVPDGWAQDVGRPSPLTSNGNRWVKFATSRSNIANDGTTIDGPGRIVNIEDYERTLRPALVTQYLHQGYCWVVSGSTQSGRAKVQPGAVPQAVAYYAALARHGTVAHVASPYGGGRDAVRFNFDWSFDYYPLAYERPGPVMTVYHLHGGRCG